MPTRGLQSLRFPHLFPLSSPSDDAVDCDFEDPQVYESMCNIQSQAACSEAAPPAEPGDSAATRETEVKT